MKRKKGKIGAWILVIDGKPNQLFTSDPQLKDYEIWRQTILSLHGKKAVIKPCTISYDI